MLPALLERHLRPALRGVLVGWLGLLLFLALHLWLVRPIWDAAPRGLAYAGLAGAAVGVLHERLQKIPRLAGARGGLLLGLLAAAALVPFLVGGSLRTVGEPAWVWAGVLGLLAVGVARLVLLAVGEPRMAAWTLAILLAVNAMPAVFLTFITNFHELPVQPAPMTVALGGVYGAAGWVLGTRRD